MADFLEYKNKLNSERNRDNQAKSLAKVAASPIQKAKLALSFGKKVKKNWGMLFLAVCFDILALIPILSVLINFTFGLLLFLHFGPRKKPGEQSEIFGVVLPIALGSLFDWFFSIIPVNIGATLIRIALSKDTVEEKIGTQTNKSEKEYAEAA